MKFISSLALCFIAKQNVNVPLQIQYVKEQQKLNPTTLLRNFFKKLFDNAFDFLFPPLFDLHNHDPESINVIHNHDPTVPFIRSTQYI